MRQRHLLLILLAFLSGCTQIIRTKTYLMPPTVLGMEEVAPKVFVNKEMPPTERENIAKIVVEAKERLVNFYGGTISAPVVLACSTEECFAGLGGTTQRGLHLGKSKVLLAPRGLTAPILVHEWSHAELATRVEARLDGLFGARSIPTWFNEGIAVVVSEEPLHSEKIWEDIVAARMPTPILEDLVSIRDWNKAVKQYGDGVPGKICVVYATAGHEVRTWHQRVGREGLLRLIDKIKSGEGFEKSFKSTGNIKGSSLYF